MRKLEMIAKAILADAKNPDIPEEKKLETIEEGLKSIGADMVNAYKLLADAGIAIETIGEVMETQGISWDGRAKKFK